MLVSDVVNEVRTTTGDVSALQFTDAQIVNWINNAIRQCAVDNNLLEKRGNQATVVGQTDYTIPTDVLKIHSVAFNNRTLKAYDLTKFNEEYNGTTPSNTEAGDPELYYIFAGVLTLYPAPSTVKTLVINYTYNPVNHSPDGLGDTLRLPVGYHSRVVDYCLAQVYLQDDNVQMYQLKMQEFTTGVAQLRDQHDTFEDVYPSMMISSRDAGGWSDRYYG